MLTSLRKCRACRLSWFPRGETAAACPACGGTKLGGTLEPFHIGVAFILLGLSAWAAPRFLGDRVALTLPAILQSKPALAEAERAPSRAAEAQAPPAKVVRSTKVKSSKSSKSNKKKKKRSKHVQR